MVNEEYVHGYSDREATRLNDQAATLESIIHNDTIFPKGSYILEAGCGVGAQTKIIAIKNPESTFLSVDISENSLAEAKVMIQEMEITNVKFQQADLYGLTLYDETFDNIIVCLF